MNDTEIVDLYWQRNSQAITETDKKYGGYCQSIAYRICRSAEDVELSAHVAVTGSKALPRRYDGDTIVMDLDEKALAVLKEKLGDTLTRIGGGDTGEDPAVSMEMGLAMLRYMPLHTFVSFASLPLRELDEMIEKMNAE